MNDYKFQIINLGDRTRTAREANSVYQQWLRVFGEVLAAKGERLDPDDFFRQDLAFVLKQGNEFIGFCFGTFFNLHLEHHWQHHYLKELPQHCLRLLNERGDCKLMSIEYLTIHPQWRKKIKEEINWSEVMISLALLKSDEARVHGVIATPRIDVKVNETLLRLGSTTLQTEIDKMNYVCSLEFLPQQRHRLFPDLRTARLVRSLWQRRIAEESEEAPSPRKTA